MKHGNADGMSRCPNPWECECRNFEVLRCGPCKKCLRKNELMEGTFPHLKRRQQSLTQERTENVRIAKENLWSHSFIKAITIEVKKKQLSNPYIRPVYQWVKNGNRPKPQETSSTSPETHHYVLNWNSQTIYEGILHRKFYKNDLSTSHLQVVLPKEMREAFLQQMHDGIMSGHLGEKTRNRILQKFYWFDLGSDVATYVRIL